MPRIDLVVFDIAGTTLQDNGDIVNKAFQKAFNEFLVYPTPSEINSVMGFDKPEAIKTILQIKGVRDQFLVEAIHSSFLQSMIAYYKDNAIEIEGASECFKKLHEMNIKVAMDTGFSRPIVNTIFEKVQWGKNGLVDSVACPNNSIRGRPHPDMIESIMKELAIEDPSHIMKVGDTPSDMQEGHNAQCGYVVGVTSGSHSEEQLKEVPGKHTTVLSIRSIPMLIEELKYNG
jgi:phosphonatase-like hydrolase